MSETDRTTTRVTEWLSDHPRMMGALFVTLVLLSQAGAVIAGNHSATAGP